MKTCCGCHLVKDVANFYKRGRGVDSYCIPCRKHISNNWKAINADWVKNYTKSRNRADIRKFFKNKNPLAYLLSNARANAKKNDRTFGITLADLKCLWEKQGGKCFYTGRDMYFGAGTPDSPSLDRVNSTLGYLPDNIVLCQYKVNVVKNSLSVHELILFCRDVLNHIGTQVK